MDIKLAKFGKVYLDLGGIERDLGVGHLEQAGAEVPLDSPNPRQKLPQAVGCPILVEAAPKIVSNFLA